MWELIRANRRKSLALCVSMGAILIVLGYVIGALAFPPNGAGLGVVIAFCVWFFMSLTAYFSGDSIMLAVSGAKQVTHDVHPQLFNIVEEMKIAANFPHMPKIYIIPDPAPNAFATGLKPHKCSIAVTAGLLSKLNRDELQGVVAHEMSHIINRDVLFMTFTGILLGSIVLISEVFLRGVFYSSMSSRRYRSQSSSKGGGQAQLVIMIVALVVAILAPIMAQLLYFSISRKREYLADASAIRLTRYPEGLASALEKISNSNLPLASANKVTAPMYISAPKIKKGMKAKSLTSTHPPIKERVRILRNIAGSADFASYQQAYSKVEGSSAAIIPPSGLKETETLSIRKPNLEKAARRGKKKDMRDVGDLMRTVNRYAFLACVCGLKMKVPPDFKQPKLACPRCGREHEVPLATVAAVTAGIKSITPDPDQNQP
jgi:heat shock protein HtpX